MSEKPSTNPYEAPQANLAESESAEAKLIRQIGTGWQRIANSAYDQTPFSRPIPFDGFFTFRDFNVLGRRMFEHRVGMAVRIVIFQLWFLTPVWLFVGVLLFNEFGFGPEILIFNSIFVMLAGLGIYRNRFRIPNDETPIPIRGEIGPSSVTSELRDANTNTLLGTRVPFSWNEMFFLEEPQEQIHSQSPQQSESLANLLPARLILFTKCRRNTWREKILFVTNIPRFFEMICLHPGLFTDPTDWQMLVKFAREHLTVEKHTGFNQAELIE